MSGNNAVIEPPQIDTESFWTQRPKARPNSDTIFPNSDKIYLTIVTFIFLLLFNEKRDSSFPSGLWIVLFWLPAETLSLKRLHGGILTQTMETQSPMFKSPTPAGVPVII